MKKFELKYFDHDTEAIETIEFTAEEEDIKWQTGENAHRFFTIDTSDMYVAIPLADVKRVQRL